jgi:hypothetical protein
MTRKVIERKSSSNVRVRFGVYSTRITTDTDTQKKSLK